MKVLSIFFLFSRCVSCLCVFFLVLFGESIVMFVIPTRSIWYIRYAQVFYVRIVNFDDGFNFV